MENTHNDNGSQDNFDDSPSFRMRGLQRGWILRVRDVQRELGMSRTTWNEWVIAGLQVSQPGTAAELVLSDDVIDFIKEHRQLPKRKKE